MPSHAALAVATLALLAPPSGRPPIGPLERHDPRLYDLEFSVQVSTAHHPDARMKGTMILRDTPIVMPVIFQGAYSRVAPDSVRGRVTFSGPGEHAPLRLDEGFPHQTQLAVLPIVHFRGQSLRWTVEYRVESFSARIDEAAAARLTWPQEWPAEVQDGLRPQQFIESDHEIFQQTVARVSEGQLRMVPPYLAAKDLVRYCIDNVQVTGAGVRRDQFQAIRGLAVQGALETARTGRGTANDLVCVCVAMLRAAGIPARPVIGVEDRRNDGVFVVWAEMYLPGAGWIPFDPDEMRGKAINALDVRKPWPEFGTLDDLNDRIPLAYHFMPPAAVESPLLPAVWGWDPRPRREPTAEQRILVTIVSRGAGQPDPR